MTAFMKPFTGSQTSSPVLVIIPAYNEAACITDVVRDVRQNGLTDILVIDDGSTDTTAYKADQAGAYVLRLSYNLGIGGAVQTGFKFAVETGYSYVIRLDGDGQHKMTEANKLLQLVRTGKADIAIGSRFCPGQHTYIPPLSRALGIRWFATILFLITKQSAYDPTSGMQVLNKRAFTMFAADYPQDYPEVEARILIHKANLHLMEVPVNMEPRARGHSSITYLRAIYYMFKVSLATFIANLRQAPSQQIRRD